MTELVLIDLYAQRENVKAYVKDWSPEETLIWMEKYGTIQKLIGQEDEVTYTFRSKLGTVTPFRFTNQGDLIILHMW